MVHIMENECLGDRKGHDGHLAKKIVKKYYSWLSLLYILYTRQQQVLN